MNSALVGSAESQIKCYDLDSSDDKALFCLHPGMAPKIEDGPIRALAWYPADTGLFFSASESNMIAWDTNGEKPFKTVSFNGNILDVAPQIVLSKPLVARLYLL